MTKRGLPPCFDGERGGLDAEAGLRIATRVCMDGGLGAWAFREEGQHFPLESIALQAWQGKTPSWAIFRCRLLNG